MIFIKRLKCIFKHKFSGVKDCDLITICKNKYIYNMWECTYCRRLVKVTREIHHPKKIKRKYNVKCEFERCSKNDYGYCNSWSEELKIKAVHSKDNSEFLDCENFEYE